MNLCKEATISQKTKQSKRDTIILNHGMLSPIATEPMYWLSVSFAWFMDTYSASTSTLQQSSRQNIAQHACIDLHVYFVQLCWVWIIGISVANKAFMNIIGYIGFYRRRLYDRSHRPT